MGVGLMTPPDVNYTLYPRIVIPDGENTFVDH